jgi:dipeptidyl aminopeptidase/acylaminoacyl peptidase
VKPGVVALAILIAAVVACSGAPETPAAVQSASPSPSLGATPSPETTPSATPTPRQDLDSPTPTPESTRPSIRTNALGRLTGNWLFVGKQVRQTDVVYRSENQIWAVPLDGGPAKLAFAYDVTTAGTPEAVFDNTPYLRRQFSPDGSRMVVSISGQLVVVDLVSGRVMSLGRSGYFPAWSKDGSRIAFVAYLPFDGFVPLEHGIFVVPATGGPVTQLAKVGYSTQSVEWSPDGSMVIVAEPLSTVIVDAANGNVVRVLTEIASYGSSFAHWRSAAPQIALAAGSCDRTTTLLVGLGNAGEAERTLLDTGERCPDLSIRDPRWNPAKASELLYVATRAEPGRMPHEYRAHVLDIASGHDTTLPFDASEATWTWDGARIAYLTANVQSGFGDSVKLAGRDGTGSRSLLEATGDDFFFSFASVGY